MTTYQISDDLFWGFRIVIENNENNPVETIRNQLMTFLQEKNLVYLVNRVRNMRLHIHNYNPDGDGIVFVCSCN